MASINLGRVVGQDGSDGKDAKINGVNTLTLEAGSNITLEQEGSTLTINSTASGGTTNYSDLSNKPKINNVELSGNKTTSDLNISYNDLTNKPTIPTVPTNVSAFTNDVGYTTNTGTITSVKMNGNTVSSSGEADLGTVITDISSKQDTIDSSHKLSSDLVDDTNNTNLFVSSTEKTTWSGKQDALVSGTNIKTINNTSILGSGNLDTEVIQYSTMPTASSTNVGQIVQFIGTTDSTYINGYFYKCVSDGQTTPTYSWEAVNVQAGSGGAGDPVFIFNYNDDNTTKKATAQAVYDFVVSKGYFPRMFYNNYGTKNEVHCNSSITGSSFVMSVYYFGDPGNYYFGTPNFYFTGIIKSTVSNGTVTNVSYAVGDNYYNRSFRPLAGYGSIQGGSSVNDSYKNDCSALTVANTTAYTPTADYHPATKKYVDDKLTSLTGYDATKTQVLKNIQGVLTWVDE